MLFKNRSALAKWMGWVILQQSIAAAGTWSTAQAIYAIQQGQEARPWILITLLGILLPYVPALFSRKAIKQWEFLLHQSWIETWLTRLRGRLDLYNDSQKRDTFLGMLQQDGPVLITQLSSTTSDLFTMVLNFALQWMVLTFFYSQALGLCLASGVLLASLLIIAMDPRVKDEARNAAEANTQMSRLLPGAWERTIHDNPQSAPYWTTRFNKSFEDLRLKSLKSLQMNLTITGLSLFGMTLPLITTILLFPETILSPTSQLLLVAILPRLLQTIQSAINGLTSVLNLRPLLVRIKELERKLPEIQDPQVTAQDLLQRISPTLREQISLSPLLMESPGRTTVQAPNGSGKSSLLLHIKSTFGSSAYYLPPVGGLPLSDKQSTLPGSTGQNRITQIQALAEQPPAPMLLLDEWDANLDAHHTQELDRQLELMAKYVRIIEVRH